MSSFHQIELEKESRPLTAFSTQRGHFTRLPFGLKIATNSFQRMLNIALAGLESKAFLYVDDIITIRISQQFLKNFENTILINKPIEMQLLTDTGYVFRASNNK